MNSERKKIYMKEYVKRNRSKISAQAKAYRRLNADKIRDNFRNWIDKNREHRLQWKRQWREKNRHKIIHQQSEWRENNPLLLAIYQSTRNGTRSEYNREWRAKNRQRVRWHKAIRYRGRPVFSVDDWLLKLDYYGWRCRYCRCDLSRSGVVVDHAIPVSRGGTNALSNLMPSCKRCNARKNSKTFFEFIKRRY